MMSLPRWMLSALLVLAMSQSIAIVRGRRQHIYVSGPVDGTPVLVSSGDGGWIHLAPHVAQLLASNGYRVIGFDVRAYLESFTSGRTTLQADEEPADYRALLEQANGGRAQRTILVGVSEGAGLSVLAASSSTVQSHILGVICLGLPDLNELGWRWRDSVTYLTHRLPNEPVFSASAVIARVAPFPIAAIHSTHDEYVPLSEAEGVLRHAGPLQRLWIVPSSDHRFSDNLGEFDRRLLEAMDWVRSNAPR